MLAVAAASQSALAPASAPSRRAVLRGAAGLLALPSAAFAADPALVGLVPPPPRTGLTGKWLENLRIVLQDSADDVKYGGELAPGGPPTSTPAQLLLPIVQMEVALKSLAPSVADEKHDAAAAPPPKEASHARPTFSFTLQLTTLTAVFVAERAALTEGNAPSAERHDEAGARHAAGPRSALGTRHHAPSLDGLRLQLSRVVLKSSPVEAAHALLRSGAFPGLLAEPFPAPPL